MQSTESCGKKAAYHLVKSLVLPLIVSFEDFLALSPPQFAYVLSEEITEDPCGKDWELKLWFRKIKLATRGNEQMMLQDEFAASIAEVENSCYFP